MEFKIFTKMINRKKFFTTTSLGAVGFFLLRSFPFKNFNKVERKKVIVRINPQAVSRKKAGEKNV